MPNLEKDVENVIITAKLIGSGSSAETKLISYSYVVHAAPIGTNDFKEVKNSGSVISRGQEKEINIPLDSYLPAKIKVQITAINENLIKAVKTESQKEYKDIKDSLCPDTPAGDTIWRDIE